MRTLCATLAILFAPSLATAIPDTGLVISEIFFDVAGGPNDQHQWVELYNGTGAPIDLSTYSLGFGRNDYTRTTVQLSGTVQAGATFVVGGTLSDPLNYNPTLQLSVDFNPDIRTGSNNNWADGVALFDILASAIVQGSDPIHAVIYGEATATARNWLTDESGAPGSGSILVTLPTSGIAGQSISLQPDGSWAISATPGPNVPEPGTGLLVSLALVGIWIAGRRVGPPPQRQPVVRSPL